MNSFSKALSSGTSLLWIDSLDYAETLLGGGKVPWLDLSEIIAWQRKVQSLLPSDVVCVPVERVMQAWCAAHAPTVDTMRAKRRAGASLRALLADTGLRRYLVELTGGLRSCFPSKALALVLPSPARLLVLAHRIAFDEDLADIDLDVVDSASVYVADFLREFAESGPEVALLDEGAADALPISELVSVYTPIFNLADHYRWVVGVKTTAGTGLEALAGPGFVIAPAPAGATPTGLSVGAEFWAGGDAPPAPQGGFRFVTVPRDHNPESVLQRIAQLR